MTIMVTGSRDWPVDEWAAIYDVLDRLANRAAEHNDTLYIVHGAAAGPDSLADEWASDTWHEVEVEDFPPDYETHGKRAPHVRNDVMLSLVQDDQGTVIAFWDGKSRGTKSVIDKAIKRGLNFEVYSPAGVYVEV